MLQQRVCTSCDGRSEEGQHRFPPLVFNRRGSALCSHCAHGHMDAPLDVAIRVSGIKDNYSFVEIGKAEGACIERAFTEGDPCKQATHVYIRQDGTCVVVYMRERGRTAPKEKLRSLFLGPPPNTPPDPGVVRLSQAVTCSFCSRGRRTAQLITHIKRSGKRPALTYCAECLFVACDLFRKDGVLPSFAVRHGEFINDQGDWRETTRVWRDTLTDTPQQGALPEDGDD